MLEVMCLNVLSSDSKHIKNYYNTEQHEQVLHSISNSNIEVNLF